MNKKELEKIIEERREEQYWEGIDKLLEAFKVLTKGIANFGFKLFSIAGYFIAIILLYTHYPDDPLIEFLPKALGFWFSFVAMFGVAWIMIASYLKGKNLRK